MLPRSVSVKPKKRKAAPKPAAEFPSPSLEGSGSNPSGGMNSLLAVATNDDPSPPGELSLEPDNEEMAEEELAAFLVDMEKIRDQKSYLKSLQTEEDVKAAAIEVVGKITVPVKSVFRIAWYVFVVSF